MTLSGMMQCIGALQFNDMDVQKFASQYDTAVSGTVQCTGAPQSNAMLWIYRSWHISMTLLCLALMQCTGAPQSIASAEVGIPV